MFRASAAGFTSQLRDDKRASREQWARRASAVPRMTATLVIVALAFVTPSHLLAADGADGRGRRDGGAERKLLAELERIRNVLPDHLDPQRFDHEMAAAFRGYGLDLELADPKEAGSRLAGRPSTPAIVAAIDDWCRARRVALVVPTWRRLGEVVRAADADPWRNSLRDQYEHPPVEAIPTLRARAASVKAMEKQPLASLLLLARMLLDAGEPATATPVLHLAERRFPDDFWVCFEQGNLNLIGAPDPDPTEAVRYFARAAALRPRSAAAHDGLGDALFAQKKFDEAIAEHRLAIKLNPVDAVSHYSLGGALREQGKQLEAIAALREAIRLKPDFYEAHFALGIALGTSGKFNDSVAAFREAIRLQPDLAIDQSNVVLHDQGKEGAAAALREAIRLTRGVAATPSALVIAAPERRQAITPVAIRHPAFQPDPQALAHFDLGHACLSNGDYNKAIAELDQAIRIQPNFAEPYVDRGFARSNNREYDKAIADYDKAIGLDPQNLPAYNFRAWLRATCPDPTYRDGNLALESAIWACALSGWNDAFTLATLAAAYAETSDFGAAVKFQTRAIGLLTDEKHTVDFRSRLDLYQERKAFHQPGPR
jgi:tetratricopeptide (TPR) repeat protein